MNTAARFFSYLKNNHFFLFAFSLLTILHHVHTPSVRAVSLFEAQKIRERFEVEGLLGKVPLDAVKVVIIDTGFEGVPLDGANYASSLVEYYPHEFLIQNHPSPELYESQYNAALESLKKEQESLDETSDEKESEPRVFSPTEVSSVLRQSGIFSGFAPVSHGFQLAEIVKGIAPGTQLHLLNGNGKLNFTLATRYAYKVLEADIVIYSQNWKIGNGDGSGQISKIVKEATDHGVLWFTSAGNDRGLVHADQIVLDENKNLLFTRSKSPYFLEFKSHLEAQDVSITVLWNADAEEGTHKDLNVSIYDSKGTLVSGSDGQKIQVYQKEDLTSEQLAQGMSKLAREKFNLQTKDNETYRIRISAASDNFHSTTDKVWVMVKSNRDEFPLFSEGQTSPQIQKPIDFIDATPGDEIFAPADLAEGITVSTDDAFASQGDPTQFPLKPDVILSNVFFQFTDSKQPLPGTSFANAAMGAIAAYFRAVHPDLTKEELLSFVGPRQVQPLTEELLASTQRQVMIDFMGGLSNLSQIQKHPLQGPQGELEYLYDVEVFEWPDHFVTAFPSHIQTGQGDLDENFEYFVGVKSKAQSQFSLEYFFRSPGKISGSKRLPYPWERAQGYHTIATYNERNEGPYYISSDLRVTQNPSSYIRFSKRQEAFENEFVLPKHLREKFWKTPSFEQIQSLR